MNNIRPKSKNIFLILAVVCFLGIILIFLFDGYMGLYDTVTMTSGEQTQTIAPEQWKDFEKNGFPPQLYANIAGEVTFKYKIDNRRFSSYKADVSISLWQNQQKIKDILSQSVNIKAFGQETITWVIDTQKILQNPMDGGYTMEIDQGSIQRNVVFYVVVPNSKSYTPIPTIEIKSPTP
jgi:hypothetical protein